MNSFISEFGKEGEVTEPTRNGGNINFDFPTSDKPLICKLVKDPRTGKSCVQVDYIPHKVGNTDKDKRRHACRDSLGLGRSPEKDYFWELINKLKELKTEGKKDTEEYKQILAEKKLFSVQTRGALYYVEPNSPKFKALPVGPMVFNRLFGRDKTEYSAAIPSLVKQMAAKNMTPYLDKDPEQNKKGWVKIWKTGEGLATEYHMEVCTREEEKVIEGETVTVTKYEEYSLSDEVQSIIDGKTPLDVDNFPDFVEFERKQAWTEEECEARVAAFGDVSGTPERLLKKDGDAQVADYGQVNSDTYGGPKTDEGQSQPEAQPSLVAGAGPGTETAPGLDDIPF